MHLSQCSLRLPLHGKNGKSLETRDNRINPNMSKKLHLWDECPSCTHTFLQGMINVCSILISVIFDKKRYQYIDFYIDL
jgi:hypothetical protein